MRFARVFALTAVVLMSVSVVFAQDKAAVIESFNKALEMAKTEPKAAITKFNETIAAATKLGPEGTDIKDRSEKQLAPLYFSVAADLYKAKKLEESIKAFEEALAIAKKYNDESVKQRCESNIPKLYNAKGANESKRANHDAAISAFMKALEYDSKNPVYMFNIGTVYKSQEKAAQAIAAWDKSIEIAIGAGDKQNEKKAMEAIRDYLLFLGYQHFEKRDFDKAMTEYIKALTYDNTNADTYYRIAEVYNRRALWDKAIESANNALKFERGGKADRAKIYFELGTALKNKGNKSAACDAFENASFGTFKTNADYEMQHELKCGQTVD